MRRHWLARQTRARGSSTNDHQVCALRPPLEARVALELPRRSLLRRRVGHCVQGRLVLRCHRSRQVQALPWWPVRRDHWPQHQQLHRQMRSRLLLLRRLSCQLKRRHPMRRWHLLCAGLGHTAACRRWLVRRLETHAPHLSSRIQVLRWLEDRMLTWRVPGQGGPALV